MLKKALILTCLIVCCALPAHATKFSYTLQTTYKPNGDIYMEYHRLQTVTGLYIAGDNVPGGYYTATFFWSGDEVSAYEELSLDPGPFWNDPTATWTAAHALMDALGTDRYTYFKDKYGSDNRDELRDHFFVPYKLEHNYGDFYWAFGYLDENASLGTDDLGGTRIDTGVGSHDFFVKFAGASATPLPPSAWLLAPALIGFIGLRRRMAG